MASINRELLEYPRRIGGCNALTSRIAAISHYLPERVLGNDELASIYPDWSAQKIFAKTGIRERRIAASDQTAADLAYEAALRLFAGSEYSPSDVGFVILCTQAPDYILPTSACLLQHRLGIPRTAGAIDINLGCSGFVYGLSLAKGLIETSAVRCVLLLTADTYSKYIHPMDKSVRTLFGDGAAATLICAAAPGQEGSIGPFVFGTDGSGAANLMLETGGSRHPEHPLHTAAQTDADPDMRRSSHLYMNGAEIMTFSLTEVPRAFQALLVKSGLGVDDFDHFVLHQANGFILEALRKKLQLPPAKMPTCLEHTGNTVSSTIPIALDHLCTTGQLLRGQRIMLVGFGVGYSWAAAVAHF